MKITDSIGWAEKYAEREFTYWARKEWAGYTGQNGRLKEDAEQLLAELRQGEISASRRGAAKWLLDGGGDAIWTDVCTIGRIEPKKLVQVISDLYDQRISEKARVWAKKWESKGIDIIPWKAGGLVRGEVSWFDSSRITGKLGEGKDVVWKGGKGMMLNEQDVRAKEAKDYVERMEIPENLMASARRGNLCILVGAGGSHAEPANLPLYKELAREVGGVAENVPDEVIGTSLDEVRRERPSLNSDIAEYLKERERGIGYRASVIHREIVALAQKSGIRRIMTTNWDTLLAREWNARDSEKKWEEKTNAKNCRGWTPINGSAVPDEGIIMLHGSVENPEGMLVTAGDVEEWYKSCKGRNVVERCITGRTVLTVGYRWGDTILRKILGENQKSREEQSLNIYALHEKGGTDEVTGWEGGAKSLAYPEGQHEVVVAFLQRIQRELTRHPEIVRKRGLQEIAQRGGERANEADWEEIKQAAREENPAAIEHFLKEAIPEEWISERMVREVVSKGIHEGGQHNGRWTNWVAVGGTVKRIGKLCALYGKVTQNTGRIGAWTAVRWAREVARDRTAGVTEATTLLLWLMGQTSIENRDYFLLYARPGVKRLITEGGGPALLEIWEWACTPQWKQKHAYGEEPVPASGPSGTERAYELGELQERTLGAIESEDEEEWVQMFVRIFEKRQRMLDSAAGEKGAFCGGSWRRSAVERHRQDNLPQTTIDVSVDMLRELLERLGRDPQKHDTTKYVLEQCARSTSPLVRRCAVHGVNKTRCMSADEKLAWVEADGRWADYTTWHERYQLVRENWASASEEARKEHVDRREEREDESIEVEEADRRRRERYDWLTGLARDTDDKGVLSASARRAVEREPQWSPRPWSAFTHFHWSGPVVEAKPWTEGRLADGKTGIQQVLGWEPPTEQDEIGTSTIWGAKNSVDKKCTDQPDWARELAAALLESGRYEYWAWPSLCRAAGKWEEAHWEQIARAWPWQRLASRNGEQEHAVGTLIAARGAHTKGVLKAIELLIKVAEEAWEGMQSREEQDAQNGYSFESINRADGKTLEGLFTAAAEATRMQDEAERCGNTQKGQAGEKGRRSCLEAIRRMLQDERVAGHALGCAAAHGVIHGAWLGYHEPQWLEEQITRGMGTDSETAKAVRDTLRYAEYHTSGWIEVLQKGLHRELMREDFNLLENAENVATKWAQGILLGSEWWSETAEWIEWTWGIAEFPEGSRVEILKEAATLLGHHREPAEQQRMWQNGIRRAWEEIDNLHGVTTRREKQALVECFSWLTSSQQEEFEVWFRKGDKIPPCVNLVEENREGNREATIRLADQFQDGNDWIPCRWGETLEAIHKWVVEGLVTEPAKSLAQAVLAKHGC